MSKIILAFVGMPGSGKSTCVDHVTVGGLPSVHFGNVVVEEAKRRNNGIADQKTEKIVREEYRKIDGMATIAIRTLPRINESLKSSAVVVLDGMYSWSEYTLLKEKFGRSLVVVAVVANRHLRYERLEKRPVRPLTSTGANQRDITEIETLEKGGPIAIADYTLTNNESTKELIKKLDSLLEQLKISL